MQTVVTVISVIISVLSIVFCILTFALNRKDKAVKDTKEENGNQVLINYRLNKVEEKLDKIIGILDGYEEVIKKYVADAMERHIEIYHRKDN